MEFSCMVIRTLLTLTMASVVNRIGIFAWNKQK